MKPVYFKHIACVAVFLLIGLYDVWQSFMPLVGFMVLLVMLLGAFAGTITRRIWGFSIVSWKMFLTALLGFCASIAVGACFNSSVDLAGLRLLESIDAYKNQHGYYPAGLMDVASADNIGKISRGKIKYGARVHYLKTEDGFHLTYYLYPGHSRFWDADKRVFVDALD